MKKFLKVVIVLLILICLAGGAFLFALNKYEKGIGPVDKTNTEQIQVTIPGGTSGYGILDILYDNGLLSDINIGKVFLKLNTYNTLQA
ncbi:MAG: hypothetical protein MJ171_08215, partial [Clostridia bacterium]|nr:hypothetical protein [Clostridia bacterium]